MQKIITVLGVPFHLITLSESVRTLDQACEGKKKFFCVTPNPEICLLANRERNYAEILRQADLSIPDGFGILWADRFLQGRKNFFRWLWTLVTPQFTPIESSFPERVTGTDVMMEFCERYPKRKIFLLGASEAVNEKLTQLLRSRGVKIVGNFSGSDSVALEMNIVERINHSKAEVLFVAFGAPKQERWISRNFGKLKTIHVAMGIGGAFDFLAGTKKRAPAWMRKIGLEWLYRLMKEPKRVRRIVNATVVFPWRVYRSG